MSKYFYEIGKQFSGDKTLAESYMGVARGLLGGLVEMSGNVFQNKRTYLLPDGTHITVSFAGRIANVAIHAPERKLSVDSESSCRLFLSGLLTAESIEVTTDSDGQEHRALQWLYTSEYQQALTENIAPKVSVEAFTGEFVPVNPFMADSVPATYGAVFAGAYSGAMRQAIQLYLGMGIELVKSYLLGVGDYVYNFGYYGTHGLVRKFEYTDEKPAFWLVRMPKDGHGILAIDFPVCTDVSDLHLEYGVSWIPTGIVEFPSDIDAAIDSGKVIEVMPASVYHAAVGDYAPMYLDCGWAFSLSGHECQNVLVYDGAESYTKRVKVSFSADEGALSATITDYPENLFMVPLSSAPRFPTVVTLYPRVTMTQPDSLDHDITQCDVHVYYKGDEAQVFGFVWDRTKLGSTWKEGTWWNYYQYRNTYPALPGNYEGIDHSVDAYALYYTLNGEPVSDSGFADTHNYNSVDVSYYGVDHRYLITGGSTPSYTIGEPIGIGRLLNMKIMTGRNKNIYQLLLVPLFQREGAYVLDAYKISEPSFNIYPDSSYYAPLLGTTWKATGWASGACGGSGKLSVYETNTDPTFYGPITHPSYPTLPAYTGYLKKIEEGGVGIDALDQCLPGSGGVVRYADASTAPVAARVVCSGRMRMFTSGLDVDFDFGTEEGAVDNTVYDKILHITSLSYVALGNACFITCWTDAINPNKYIGYDDINTFIGADAHTNTAYPLSGVDTFLKSFVGIAN